jgi:hypothetical protein
MTGGWVTTGDGFADSASQQCTDSISIIIMMWWQ